MHGANFPVSSKYTCPTVSTPSEPIETQSVLEYSVDDLSLYSSDSNVVNDLIDPSSSLPDLNAMSTIN